MGETCAVHLRKSREVLGGTYINLRKGLSAHSSTPLQTRQFKETWNKQSYRIPLQFRKTLLACFLRTNVVCEKSGGRVQKMALGATVKKPNLQILQTEKLGFWIKPDYQRNCEGCKWALRSKIGLKVRDHKSPSLIKLRSYIYLPPSVNTNLCKDGLNQLLNQQALAPPWKEPIPGPLRVDPCSVWGTSRRSAELSKAGESPYSVLLLIMLSL